MEETYRWIWSYRGEYTKPFDPTAATEFLEYLRRRAGKGDNYLDHVQKSVKRLFNYWRHSDNRRIEEWKHGIEIATDHSNDGKKGHDRFRPHEIVTHSHIFHDLTSTTGEGGIFNTDSIGILPLRM